METVEKKPSVLLIEDDDDISSILAEMLMSWGYIVVTAQSLPSALIKVNNQKFNLILLDIVLKKVSGLKLLEQIRRNTSNMNFQTPIVLHSGFMEVDMFDKHKGDIDDALVKPSSAALIKEKIAYWTTKKHDVPTAKISFIREYVHRRIREKTLLTDAD